MSYLSKLEPGDDYFHSYFVNDVSVGIRRAIEDLSSKNKSEITALEKLELKILKLPLCCYRGNYPNDTEIETMRQARVIQEEAYKLINDLE